MEHLDEESIKEQIEIKQEQETYNQYLARMGKHAKRDRIEQIIAATLMYAGLGSYILYEYWRTGENKTMLIAWWVIGGWFYYWYGVRRWL